MSKNKLFKLLATSSAILYVVYLEVGLFAALNHWHIPDFWVINYWILALLWGIATVAKAGYIAKGIEELNETL